MLELMRPEPEPTYPTLTEADDRAYFEDAGLIVTDLNPSQSWKIERPDGLDAGVFVHSDRNGDTESHLSRRKHIRDRLTRG